MKPSVLTATVLLLAIALPAGAEDSYDSGPARTHATAAGTVLTNPMGMTLYTYDRDTAGSSNCTGSCAQNWPPFTADKTASETGDFALIERGDGTKQWTYDDKPLYLFVGDKKPGDVSGNGVGGVWHAVMEDEDATGSGSARSGSDSW